MSRAALTLGLVWGFAAGLATASASDASPRVPHAASTRWEPVSMRLGLSAEPSATPEAIIPQSGTPSGQKANQCSKWRAMAHQLGETFAGHALRESVLKRVCVSLGSERQDDVWDWPWAGFPHGRLLPPRTHRAVGDWQIRCGAVSKRQRCALLHLAKLPGAAGEGSKSPQIVAHVVIDMVAGRETVLWRVFVPQRDAATRGAHLATLSDAPGQLPAVVPARQRPSLTYRIGALELSDRYSTCAPAGCMMEANLKNAGAVVSGLWDGVPVDMHMPDAEGGDQVARLPARGFKAGLAELMRLRREELTSKR